MERTPAELARAWREALVARDPAAFGALFAEDAVFEDVEHRTDDLARVRPIAGREAIEATTRAWVTATPPFAFDLLDVLGDERSAAARWRYAVAGPGGEVAVEGVTWLTCASGAIERALVLFDSHAFLRDTGAVA